MRNTHYNSDKQTSAEAKKKLCYTGDSFLKYLSSFLSKYVTDPPQMSQDVVVVESYTNTKVKEKAAVCVCLRS